MLSAKIAYRNLPRRKARTVLTIVAVMLGVALLVGINLATAAASSEFTGYINRFWGATDIIVRYPGIGPLPFEANGNLSIVNQVPEIRQTVQRLDWFGSLDNMTVFQLIGVNRTDFDYSTFNITGTAPLSPGSAVVGNTLTTKYGLALGSTIKVLSETPSLPPRTVALSLTVIGINNPLRNIGSTVYVFLPELQTALGLQGKITHIFATISDPSKALEVQRDLQHLMPAFDVSAPKAEAVHRIQGQMTGFNLGLNAMVAVSLVVCSFIVFNTLYMTVNERTYEIGVMRAVGSSRRQVFNIFFGEGLLIGLVGASAGLIAGWGLSRLFTRVAEQLLEIPSLPVTQLTPYIVLTGIAAGLGAVVAGALYPAVSASRIDIIRAIRPSARDKPRRVSDSTIGVASGVMLLYGSLQAFRLTPVHISYLDVALIPLGLIVLGGLAFSRASQYITAPLVKFSGGVGYVASRSGRRRLVRNAVCFGMITITLSFVVMLGGIQAGTQQAIEQGIREALGADIFLVANQSIPISFTSNLAQLPQVSVATPLSPGQNFTNVRAVNPLNPNVTSQIGVLAVDPANFPKIISYAFINSPTPEHVYGQLASSNESLMLPDGLASRLRVGVGDNVSLTAIQQGLRKIVQFKIAGVFTGPVLQYLRFGENFASESIVVSFASQLKYFAGNMHAPIFLVNLKPETKSQAAAIAHDIAIAYPKYDLAENSVTLSELLSLVRGTIDRIFALILLILYFALLIATLGIAATMIMSVADRRREIGLLRSQGMSRGQITGLFLGEGVTLGLFGFLLAIPGGLLLLVGATNSTTIAGFWLPFIVPWNAIVQSLVLAMLAVVAGSLYPALRASRMDVTRALEQV